MIQTNKAYGYIKFDPTPLNDSTGNMFKEWWMIVLTNDDIGDYYRWLFHKNYGLLNWVSITDNLVKNEQYFSNIKLQQPAWGAHISVIRGEIPYIDDIEKSKEIWNSFKNEYDGKKIEFEYELQPKTNGKHWWLRVICDELKSIREKMNYQRSEIGLHLTLGIPTPNTLIHSDFIYNTFLKNNI